MAPPPYGPVCMCGPPCHPVWPHVAPCACVGPHVALCPGPHVPAPIWPRVHVWAPMSPHVAPCACVVPHVAPCGPPCSPTLSVLALTAACLSRLMSARRSHSRRSAACSVWPAATTVVHPSGSVTRHSLSRDDAPTSTWWRKHKTLTKLLVKYEDSSSYVFKNILHA